uniref:G_PROTEIN_RECEP_F1_2 domain-containing protein n=1 Tax=Steinernema glaseri TaxID=37863 RepID=A0A1I7Y4B0_9BILA
MTPIFVCPVSPISAYFFPFVFPSTIEVNHNLIYWSGIWYASSIMTTGLADMFNTIDRVLAISYPVRYAAQKKRFVLVAFASISAVFGFVFFLMLVERIEPGRYDVMFGRHITYRMSSMIMMVNAGVALFNVPVAVVFFCKLRKFNKSLLRSNKSASTANMVVLHQMILSIVFWIVPTIGNIIALYVFKVNFSVALGPYIVTLLMTYLMACSIMYRRKLVRHRKPHAVQSLWLKATGRNVAPSL